MKCPLQTTLNEYSNTREHKPTNQKRRQQRGKDGEREPRKPGPVKTRGVKGKRRKTSKERGGEAERREAGKGHRPPNTRGKGERTKKDNEDKNQKEKTATSSTGIGGQRGDGERIGTDSPDQSAARKARYLEKGEVKRNQGGREQETMDGAHNDRKVVPQKTLTDRRRVRGGSCLLPRASLHSDLWASNQALASDSSQKYATQSTMTNVHLRTYVAVAVLVYYTSPN